MKKSMPLARVVDSTLPASEVPIGRCLSRFIPLIVVLTSVTWVRMSWTADKYVAEVVESVPAVFRMYSFPTTIYGSVPASVFPPMRRYALPRRETSRRF